MSNEKIKTAIPTNSETIKTTIKPFTQELHPEDFPITNDEPLREYGRLDNDRN
jgi:hypothetical protein